ncbi:TerC family protein [Methylorubrum sp. SB2]|uniref:TerC family protein n=1 Tax=Methylorubrum subtropicum TaxID=3138812 RepID=UPI00313DB931
MDANFWAALAGIVWIDLLLSGDNAVVIAMVCARLPPAQRRMGIVLGATAAVGLRIVFAFGVAWLMAVPGLSLVGGLFLLWVATKLVIDHGADDEETEPSSTLLGAVTTIAIADAGMSLDNVLAIAALAHGNFWLMALGVLLSIPVVIAGSTLISGLLTRFPVLVWAGAALLGWVAGGIIASDNYVKDYLKPHVPLNESAFHYGLAAAGLALTLAVGLFVRFRHSRAARA